MSEKILALDNQRHELKLGTSFEPKSKVAFHSIRYDFKPASVDTSQEAQVEIGEGHHVTLTVPHVEGSGKTHTVYKGHKRPVSKECVLIIDHDTGTFTLERLSNNVNVKKTRSDTSTKAPLPGRPVTPVDPKIRSSPNKQKSSQNSPAPVPAKQPSPTMMTPVSTPVSTPKLLEHGTSVIGEISDSSSDSDSLSSSDSDDEEQQEKSYPPVPMTMTTTKPQPAAANPPKPHHFSLITADLALSEDSDSDDDKDL